MNSNLTKRNYTKQSHVIINARYALSRAEIDIILTLLTAIRDEDKDFKDYEFTIKELEQKTNREWHSKQLKSTIKSLMSKPLELPTEHPNDWRIVNWFSYFEYSHTGIITCCLDKRLKPYLLEIVGTKAIANFKYLLPMNSSYSKRIYLLLKEYDKIGMRTFNVEKLQNILKVPKSYIKKYSDFKKKVLKRAEIDINKFTDLEIKMTEIKRGRKVIEVTFTIKKNHTDLKDFISYIRELYVNEPLYKNKEGRVLKCSDTGLLYYADNPSEWLDKKTALKSWEYLHEHRKNLICFKRYTFEEGVIKETEID